MQFGDDFSVGDHSNIDGQISSDGQFLWDAIDGGSGTELMRTNQNAFCQAAIGFSGRCVYRAQIDFPSNDYFVEATINIGADDDMKMGLFLRKDSSATLTYYDCCVRADTDVLRIRKREAGTFTTLQNNAFTFAINTDYLIRFEVDGSTLRTYVGGVQVGADLVDTSIPTGTRVGMTAEVGGSLTKTGNFKNFGADDGVDFTNILRETGGARDRTYYDLTPIQPPQATPVRETAGATDRAFYDLVAVLSGTVRERAGGTDRALTLNTEALSYTVRESAVGTDGLDTGSHVAGETQAPSGPSMAILTHIYDYFGPGDDWAFSDTRRTAPAHAHMGRVMQWGTSTREIPVPPGGPPRLGRLVIEFDDNPDPVTGVQYFRSQFGLRTPKGKRVDLKIGPADGKESLFQTPAAGVIEHATFPPGKMRLEIPDARYKQLQKPMPGLINDKNFANLPVGVKDGFSKWVFGNVSSVGFGAQGALPCIHVDTVLHRYDGARHSIESATVYTKEPTETVFQVTPYSWSIVEEIKTIDGNEYTFAFIQFASALPEGTEVRADIRGLPGSGGWWTTQRVDPDLASRNVMDHAVSIAYYVDAIEKGRVRPFEEAFATWDLPSMATVWHQIRDKGWEVSDYAITEPLTFEVILTHLFSTFLIHWFPSRLDKTKTVMSTDEIADNSPIFGDFHSILEQSETQELALDTRNRIYYNFAKIHEGTGRFAAHGTYDNTADQAALTDSDGEPIIEAEEIDLHACRDDEVALQIAVEWSTWRDQQAHRVSFELDMPTKLSQAELAREFLLTNYGGLAAGGWTRARFFPYRMTDDYDRLKIRVDAIKRVQAAVLQPQAQDVGEWRKNSRVGPFYMSGSRKLFMVFADDTDNLKKLVVLATEEDEGALEPVDEGVFPTLANAIDSFDTVRFGDKAHAATQEDSTGRVAYHVHGMALEMWETVNQLVLASNSHGDTGVTICVRTNGEPVIVFMGDREAAGPATWDGMTIAGAGNYRRSYLTRRVDGAWTTPAMVGNPNDLAASFFPEGTPYNGAVHIGTGRAIAEADNWVRLVYSVEEPADVASTPDLWTQLLRPDNTLTAAHEFKMTTAQKISAKCVVGQPAVFQYDGTWYTAVPVGLLLFSAVYIWQGTGTPGSATFVIPIVDENTNVQVQPDTFATLNPPFSCHWFKDKLHVVMGTRIGSTTEWAILKTISPPFSEAVPDPLATPRADQVGVTWPNGTYARQGVTFETILGRDYLFKVSTGNFGIPNSSKKAILEKIDLATDVPGDNAYTVAQFLIDNP